MSTSDPTLNAAFAGIRRVPQPINEPNKTYAPGSPEKAALKARLKSMAGEKIEIPLIIGGREIRTGKLEKSVMPHDHGHVLAEYHLAGPEHIQQAIEASTAARREWSAWPWEDRAAVLLRAASEIAPFKIPIYGTAGLLWVAAWILWGRRALLRIVRHPLAAPVPLGRPLPLSPSR